MSELLTAKNPAASPPVSAEAQLLHLRSILEAWLRLLWGMAPPLLTRKQESTDATGLATSISPDGIFLPARRAGAAAADEQPKQWYLASTAHAAAHLLYSRQRYSTAGIPPMVQVLVGLLEDARVEALAAQQLPGLARLWRHCHAEAARLANDDGASLEGLLRRLAHVLADPDHEDPHPWVRKGRTLFAQYVQTQETARSDDDAAVALRQLASALGNDLGQMRRALNPRSYRPQPDYRDDNHWLWYQPGAEKSLPPPPSSSSPELPPRPPEPQDFSYPEWDFRIRRLRRKWCTVHVIDAPEGAEPSVPSPALVQQAASSLKAWSASRRSPSKRYQLHHHGDALNLDAAVQATTQLRAQRQAALRVFERQPPGACTAALVLVDHSASTARASGTAPADVVQGSELASHQHSAALLLAAMQSAAWVSAAWGFCSEGRHSVQLSRIKEFDAAFAPPAQRRLMGLRSMFSTRLGAVLRHAGAQLSQRPEPQRIVFVLGDAEVHDIDTHVPAHLFHDARQAMAALRATGICVVCLCASGDTAAALDGLWGARQWQRAVQPSQLALALRNLAA